jgi:hypothetical protein
MNISGERSLLEAFAAANVYVGKNQNIWLLSRLSVSAFASDLPVCFRPTVASLIFSLEVDCALKVSS